MGKSRWNEGRHQPSNRGQHQPSNRGQHQPSNRGNGGLSSGGLGLGRGVKPKYYTQQNQNPDSSHGNWQQSQYSHEQYNHGNQGQYNHGNQGQYRHGNQGAYNHGNQGAYNHGNQGAYNQGNQGAYNQGQGSSSNWGWRNYEGDQGAGPITIDLREQQFSRSFANSVPDEDMDRYFQSDSLPDTLFDLQAARPDEGKRKDKKADAEPEHSADHNKELSKKTSDLIDCILDNRKVPSASSTQPADSSRSEDIVSKTQRLCETFRNERYHARQKQKLIAAAKQKKKDDDLIAELSKRAKSASSKKPFERPAVTPSLSSQRLPSSTRPLPPKLSNPTSSRENTAKEGALLSPAASRPVNFKDQALRLLRYPKSRRGASQMNKLLGKQKVASSSRSRLLHLMRPLSEQESVPMEFSELSPEVQQHIIMLIDEVSGEIGPDVICLSDDDGGSDPGFRSPAGYHGAYGRQPSEELDIQQHFSDLGDDADLSTLISSGFIEPADEELLARINRHATVTRPTPNLAAAIIQQAKRDVSTASVKQERRPPPAQRTPSPATMPQGQSTPPRPAPTPPRAVPTPPRPTPAMDFSPSAVIKIEPLPEVTSSERGDEDDTQGQDSGADLGKTSGKRARSIGSDLDTSVDAQQRVSSDGAKNPKQARVADSDGDQRTTSLVDELYDISIDEDYVREQICQADSAIAELSALLERTQRELEQRREDREKLRESEKELRRRRMEVLKGHRDGRNRRPVEEPVLEQDDEMPDSTTQSKPETPQPQSMTSTDQAKPETLTPQPQPMAASEDAEPVPEQVIASRKGSVCESDVSMESESKKKKPKDKSGKKKKKKLKQKEQAESSGEEEEATEPVKQTSAVQVKEEECPLRMEVDEFPESSTLQAINDTLQRWSDTERSAEKTPEPEPAQQEPTTSHDTKPPPHLLQTQQQLQTPQEVQPQHPSKSPQDARPGSESPRDSKTFQESTTLQDPQTLPDSKEGITMSNGEGQTSQSSKTDLNVQYLGSFEDGQVGDIIKNLAANFKNLKQTSYMYLEDDEKPSTSTEDRDRKETQEKTQLSIEDEEITVSSESEAEEPTPPKDTTVIKPTPSPDSEFKIPLTTVVASKNVSIKITKAERISSSESDVGKVKKKPKKLKKSPKKDKITSKIIKDYLHEPSSSDVSLDSEPSGPSSRRSADSYGITGNHGMSSQASSNHGNSSSIVSAVSSNTRHAQPRSGSYSASRKIKPPTVGAFVMAKKVNTGAITNMAIWNEFVLLANTNGKVFTINRCQKNATVSRVISNHSRQISLLHVEESADTETSLLYTASHDRTFVITNLQTGEYKSEHKFPAPVLCGCVDWGKVFFGLQNGQISVFNYKSKLSSYRIEGGGGVSRRAPVTLLATGMEGPRRVLCVCEEGSMSIYVRDANNQLFLRSLEGHTKPPNALKVKLHQVFSASPDNMVQIHNLGTGEMLSLFRFQSAVTHLLVSSVLVVAENRGVMNVIDLKEHHRLRVIYTSNMYPITALCVDAKHDLLYAIEKTKKAVPESYSLKGPVVICQFGSCSGYQFGMLAQLVHHLSVDHINPILGPRGSAKPSEDEAYTCHWRHCTKTFTQQRPFRDHIKAHAKEAWHRVSRG